MIITVIILRMAIVLMMLIVMLMMMIKIVDDFGDDNDGCDAVYDHDDYNGYD